LQPELLGMYALRGTAHGKRIAVVGDGPSLDYVNWAWINSHDVVIVVDYLGLQFDYDYIISNSLDVVRQLEPTDKLVVPYMLEDKMNLMASKDVVPQAIQVEMGEVGVVASVFPPFCDFGNVTLLALHFALFLGPQSITLFGCDNKILGGKSHTSLIKQYDGGQIWPESEQTSKRLNFYEFGVDQLGKLALQLDIPLIRVGHA